MGLLTDDLRAQIGREITYAAPEAYGSAAFRYFAIAIGDDNPLYVDRDAAAAAGYDDVIAPPTLVCETNQYMTGQPDDDGYIGHSWALDVPGTRLVRGGHHYTFGRPLRPDDVVTVTWRIDNMTEKTTSGGRPMLIVTSTATHRSADGEVLATNTETLIYS